MYSKVYADFLLIKIGVFFYPRVYSISVYKMDTHFENNGIGDFVYQTVVVSKYFELTMRH